MELVDLSCNVCGNSINNKKYILQEMMYGTGEKFDYFKCANCGCLQIATIPKNIIDYYPKDYLQFSKAKSQLIRSYLLNQRENYILSGKGRIGKILVAYFGSPNSFSWFYHSKLKKHHSILEIGCGDGGLLKKCMQLVSIICWVLIHLSGQTKNSQKILESLKKKYLKLTTSVLILLCYIIHLNI